MAVTGTDTTSNFDWKPWVDTGIKALTSVGQYKIAMEQAKNGQVRSNYGGNIPYNASQNNAAIMSSINSIPSSDLPLSNDAVRALQLLKSGARIGGDDAASQELSAIYDRMTEAERNVLSQTQDKVLKAKALKDTLKMQAIEAEYNIAMMAAKKRIG